MVPVSDIVTRLKADTAIAAIVGTLVSDYDVRRDKNPTYFTTDGDVKPCLVVDDNGELPVFGTHVAMAQDIFYVWILGPLTDAGRTSVRTLTGLVIASLSDFQVTTSKQLVQYTRQRLGDQGATVTEGVMDRLIFSVAGVHTGVAA